MLAPLFQSGFFRAINGAPPFFRSGFREDAGVRRVSVPFCWRSCSVVNKRFYFQSGYCGARRDAGRGSSKGLGAQPRSVGAGTVGVGKVRRFPNENYYTRETFGHGPEQLSSNFRCKSEWRSPKSCFSETLASKRRNRSIESRKGPYLSLHST